MLEFIKSAPWTFGIGAALFVCAIVGVIVGVVTKGRWKDKGLMVREGIKGEVKLKWPRSAFPLPVWTPPDTPGPVLDAFNKARIELAEAAGKPLFMQADIMPFGYKKGHPIEGHVELSAHLASGEMQRDRGTTDLRFDKKDGRVLTCTVSVPAPVDSDLYFPIMLHELCHVLGLDHDEQRESIMYPSLQGRPQAITDGDKALLKKLYGEKA